MKSPIYSGEFHSFPGTEMIASMGFFGLRASQEEKEAAQKISEQSPILKVGVKTITHSRFGNPLVHHNVAVVELGDYSFDLSPSHARAVAQKLLECADSIERK